ncbi:hypothetical protein NRK98_20190 [Aeromonas dhakensis]|uniref:hypothetical protein n=1 Tax=Aeromonas dhakensis TaxID=196024 RepID=UPI00227A532C|nr:hypothetical protein [Aeromonas dhakensis]WAF68185.1 hypothetical protein NRK98_20190 [Aeromonas dhakensis]
MKAIFLQLSSCQNEFTPYNAPPSTRQAATQKAKSVASKKPLKIRLDSRRRLSRMPLPQQPKAALLFNNLNQAICVGTHSIEHQKQFLIFNV